MSVSIPTAVLGASGYVSGELLRLIALHPAFELAAAVSDSQAGKPISTMFPHLGSVYGDASFVAHDNWTASLAHGSELALFSAAPHGASAAIISSALDAADQKDFNTHIVDVSADFRYETKAAYEAVYGIEHGAPELLQEFSCAVPEHATSIDTPHIGHPGCFATAVLLASVPLMASGLADSELYVTGVTGSTGSGRQVQAGTHHPERHSNLYAYKPLEHRHTPEITALLSQAAGVSATVNFVPHSGPFARGIYVTVQAKARDYAMIDALRAAFDKAYQDAAFIDVVDGTPKLKDVVASNRCQIGLAVSDDAVVVTCAIDNLVKGAAGGAIQWMNRLWGLDETAGLTSPAPAWI